MGLIMRQMRSSMLQSSSIHPGLVKRYGLTDSQRLSPMNGRYLMILRSPLSKGSLFYVNVRGYADVTMSSPIDEIIVYYPKLRNPDDEDVPFLKVNNIPSSRRLEAKATLNIQNSSMLRIDANGYVDLTKSGPLGDITVFYPKADPDDPDVAILRGCLQAASTANESVQKQHSMLMSIISAISTTMCMGKFSGRQTRISTN